MMEQVIAQNLTVTCSDGSCHENVTLTICDNKRIYTTPDGCKLCVKLITAGTINVPLTAYAAIIQGCPMEVD
jgi:hypothetical protein